MSQLLSEVSEASPSAFRMASRVILRACKLQNGIHRWQPLHREKSPKVLCVREMVRTAVFEIVHKSEHNHT